MFVNTCGGDQNPLPRRTVELCEKYGHMLAVAVEDVLKKPLKTISPGIRTAFEMIDLRYLNVVSREELMLLVSDTNELKACWAKRLLSKAEGRRKIPGFLPVSDPRMAAWQRNAVHRHGRGDCCGLCLAIQIRIWRRNVGLGVR
jgi:hypothetical protein